MNNSLRGKIRLALASAVVIVPLAGGMALSGVSAEKAVLSTGGYSYIKVEAPPLKPAWTSPVAVVDKGMRGLGVAAIAENGKIFTLLPSRKMVAINATTGSKLWEFGSDLAPLFTYSNGNIYGMTTTGSLYAISEAGKKNWSNPLSFSKADSVQKIGNTVYITQAEQLAAVDAATGKLKWKIAENSTTYIGLTSLMEIDGVLIRNYLSQGTLTLGEIVAYDARTGKKLWGHYRQDFPLAVKDGLLYSNTPMEMLDEDPVNRKIKVSVFNLKNGELKGERLYRWTDSDNTAGVFSSGGTFGSAFLDGDNFYVFQGKQLVKYDFWNYSADGEPVQKWDQTGMNQSDFPLNLVYQDRMFYKDYSTGNFSAIKLSNGQIIRYNSGENPVVQADIYGNVEYVGQSDGLFHAYDLLTLKPLFTVNTGSRDFAPTLKTGGMLIIQTGGKLLAIKLPSSLK
ncbi:MAG: PQQ-binding-like beta-propeller repeat protein [Paenibacillus sp.]|nr:PQQ-binding-like beta-propeller repeat protein [Paenibacillus sp.]